MRRSAVLFLISLLTIVNSNAQQTIDHWESLVNANNLWHYHVGATAPPTDWKNESFDGSAWSEGPGGFGYGDDDDGTVIGQTSSVYLRIQFNVIDKTQIGKIILLCDYDDAYVAYLNGVEISRSGISGTPPAHDQYAESQNEAFRYQGLYPGEVVFTEETTSELLQDGVNTLAIQTHNVNATSSDLSSNFYLVAGLTIAGSYYQPVPNWFRAPAELDASNLPLIIINTGGRHIPDEPKMTATMGIIDNGVGKVNHLADSFTDYNGKIGIEIRGSSSQMFPKKQYAVELWTDNGLDTSASVLGLPSEEDWVLYAPYSDKSLLRNVLAYKFSREMGWYAPRTKLVELYLNNQYQGVYVFTEKIKRDRHRVNISKLNPDENSGDDLTGGYIVKLDKFDGATVGFGWDSPYLPPGRVDNQVVHFQYHYPKEDEITGQQAAYIQNHITSFENALHGPFFSHPTEGYRNMISMESFVDFALVNELSKNVDGYRLSTFLHKDRDSEDGKIYIGPVWDYNLAFGNANYCDGGSTQGWAWDFNSVCPGDWWLIPFWWKRLLRDPVFINMFKNRWNELRSGQLSNETVLGYIDSVAHVLDQPQQRNFTQWPILSDHIWPNNYVGNSYANEIGYLKSWIRDRFSWLDANINAMEIVTSLDDEVVYFDGITIYPNPSDGDFSLRISSAFMEDIQVQVYSQMGKLLINKKLKISSMDDGFVSFSNPKDKLSQGIYLLKVSDGLFSTTQKLIVN